MLVDQHHMDVKMKVTPKLSPPRAKYKDMSTGKQGRTPLFRKHTYDAVSKKFGPWTDIFTIRKTSAQEESFAYPFPNHKGELCIYANLLSGKRQQAISKELMTCDLFRQYPIQGGNEPRTHFLLHEKATDDFDGTTEQPGYRYGNTRMKARPLKKLPKIEKLSRQMESVCIRKGAGGNNSGTTTNFWNIGVNPVLYRDGVDSMGFHADDDQGEELILTVLVRSPSDVTRRVVIRPMSRKIEDKWKGGDEEYVLLLTAGDAYSMDGK